MGEKTREELQAEIIALQEQLKQQANRLSYVESLEQKIEALNSQIKELKSQPKEALDPGSKLRMREQDMEIIGLKQRLKQYESRKKEEKPEEKPAEPDENAAKLKDRFSRVKQIVNGYVARIQVPIDAFADTQDVDIKAPDAFFKLTYNYFHYLNSLENLVKSKLIPLEEGAQKKYQSFIERLPRELASKNVMAARRNVKMFVDGVERAVREASQKRDQAIKAFVAANKPALEQILARKKDTEADADSRLKALKNPEINTDYYDQLNYLLLQREINSCYAGASLKGKKVRFGIADIDKEIEKERKTLESKYGYDDFDKFRKDATALIEDSGALQEKDDFEKRKNEFLSKFNFKLLKTIKDRLEALKERKNLIKEKILYLNPETANYSTDYAECLDLLGLDEKIRKASSSLQKKARKIGPSIGAGKKSATAVKAMSDYSTQLGRAENAKNKFFELYNFVPEAHDYGQLKEWMLAKRKELVEIEMPVEDRFRICKIVAKMTQDKIEDYPPSVAYLRGFIEQKEFSELDGALECFKELSGIFKVDIYSAGDLLNAVTQEINIFKAYVKQAFRVRDRAFYNIDESFKKKVMQARVAADKEKDKVLKNLEPKKKRIIQAIFG